MDLISIIIIIAIISKVIKKAQETQNKTGRDKSNSWNQTAAQSQSRQYSSGQNEEWKRLARENIEKAKQRATKKLREAEQIHEIEDKPAGTYRMPKQSTRIAPAYEQLNLQQMQRENRGAMQQVHTDRMEAEHNHPKDVISNDVLGTIEDLMIKGYDGNLCFERDFVGEAMDMISRFSVPSDVPDFSRDDVA